MDLYYFDNYQYQGLSFDFLKGLFGAFSFMNIAVNHGCDYDISEYTFTDNKVEEVILMQIPSDESISYSLLDIDEEVIKKSLHYWFFHFIEDISLEKKNGLQFFDLKEQTEFIDQVWGMMKKIMNPISFQAVGLSKFSYTFGLFSEWFIIRAEGKFYNFRLSWSD